MQTSFSEREYAAKKKTRWDRFLSEIEAVTPWTELEKAITPYYPSRHFGMKAHIGVDAQSGLVHTVIGTTANVHDITQPQALLHGGETDVFGDADYQGVEKRKENLALPVTWHVAMRSGKRKAWSETTQGELLERIEHIRAKVEHPFHVGKNLFLHRKAHYKGLAKNTAQLFSLFGLANLMLARRWFLNAHTQGAS
jgi:transposase, IS5 family